MAPDEEPFSVRTYGRTLACPSELSRPSQHVDIIIDQSINSTVISRLKGFLVVVRKMWMFDYLGKRNGWSWVSEASEQLPFD